MTKFRDISIDFPTNVNPSHCTAKSRTILTPTRHGMVKTVKKIRIRKSSK